MIFMKKKKSTPSPKFCFIIPFSLIIGEVYETFLQNYMYKVRMKLRIREVTPSSYRDYLCVSKNPLGTSEGSVRVYRKYILLKSINSQRK